MTSAARTVIATGTTSGLGFEAVRQLLQQSRPYRFILGARDTHTTQAAFSKLLYDSDLHSLSIIPLDLADLRSVKSFAHQALQSLGQAKLDILFLNAGMNKAPQGPGPHSSSWCEAYMVNHLSQHYLTHMLSQTVKTSHTRVLIVSSGLIRSVKEDEIGKIRADLLANSAADAFTVYRETKFIQFLGAHWWRRQLGNSAIVVAVSPGLVMGTGLGRHLDSASLPSNMPDAISVEEGARNLIRGFDQDDFPEDPDQIFLTSWGEWWPADVYQQTLSRSLQDDWCPSQAEIEKEAGLIS
ncbi:Short chain dehydrogenase-like protein 63 [Elsinoe fawcettii]|nr:Short chain dehydrogenase-like protein 63 [Elsinoe fawcettii]